MRRFLGISLALLAGCAPPAQVLTGEINGFNAEAIRDAVFGELRLDDVDSDGDGVADSAISAVIVFGADQDAEALCQNLADPNFPGNFLDISFYVGLGARLEAVTQAPGLAEGVAIRGEDADVLVLSQLFVKAQGVEQINASSDLASGELFVERLDGGEAFSGGAVDFLSLDFSGRAPFDVDSNGDGIADATAINALVIGDFDRLSRCAAADEILANLF